MLILVCLYVDNIIYMGPSQSALNEFKTTMMHAFKMSDLRIIAILPRVGDKTMHMLHFCVPM